MEAMSTHDSAKAVALLEVITPQWELGAPEAYDTPLLLLLLDHKKEQTWVICRDVDGPGPSVCHTEWSKSERINK